MLHQGSSAAPGSWCTYCTSRRMRRASRGREARHHRAVEADGARGLAQRGRATCGRAWSCRSRTRRPAPAPRPAASASVTPSTARTRGRGLPRNGSPAAEHGDDVVELRMGVAPAIMRARPARRRGRSATVVAGADARRAAAGRRCMRDCASGSAGGSGSPAGGAERRRHGARDAGELLGAVGMAGEQQARVGVARAHRALGAPARSRRSGRRT